jgi:hypothetical protein
MVVDSGEISLSKRSQTLIQNHELIRDSVQDVSQMIHNLRSPSRQSMYL